jgi:hypothetical protein
MHSVEWWLLQAAQRQCLLLFGAAAGAMMIAVM